MTPSHSHGYRLIQHAPGAWGLRYVGLGPGLRPSRGLLKLKRLLDNHAFWAQGRCFADLRKMLAGSQAVVSLWRGKRLVGFGRATSDGLYRAVLWDVVVAGDLQGRGLGSQVVEALLAAPTMRGVQRVYLMTTNSAGFYQQLGFREAAPQHLLVKTRVNGEAPPSASPSPAPAGHNSSPGCS
jgi:ribosomal protein S18 acetylase RimI-like enzyme